MFLIHFSSRKTLVDDGNSAFESYSKYLEMSLYD